MGMYTELVAAFALKEDTPQQVIDTLKIMTGEPVTSIYVGNQPNHPLFDTFRWEYMLRSNSYYFPGITHSEIKEDMDTFYVTIRCNLKNYDSEIEHFIDWITPYIEKEYPMTEEGKYFIGYFRYEEDPEPTLIYI